MTVENSDTADPRKLLEKHFEWMLEMIPGARRAPVVRDDGLTGEMVFVPFGEGLEIPVWFESSGSEPFEWTLTIAVDETGRPQCQLFEAKWVTSEQLHRFPLGSKIREAVIRVARPREQHGPDIVKTGKQVRRVKAQLRKQPGRRLTDEFLEDVARVYRAHVATSKPSKAVEEHFGYKPASARRVVREARLRGFLGPASPGRGGEQPKGGSDAS